MIHHPISFLDYKALPGVSNSSLKHIDRSPAHYRQAIATKVKPTPAMLKGSLTDHLLFGTEFAYDVSPYDDFRSRAAQDWKATREAAGIAIFKDADVEDTRAMVAQIKAHPGAAELLDIGRCQIGITGNIHGVHCKGLVDWVSDAFACLTDLKTTEDAGYEAFQRHIVNMGYDAQAALYLDLWKDATGEDIAWVWIVAEVEPPYATAVYVAGEDILARGREVNKRRLDRYAKSLADQSWPAYPNEVQPIVLPPWAAPKA